MPYTKNVNAFLFNNIINSSNKLTPTETTTNYLKIIEKTSLPLTDLSQFVNESTLLNKNLLLSKKALSKKLF